MFGLGELALEQVTPLRLDSRIGSKDLLGPLRVLGVTTELRRLAFGDAEIVGRGPDERPVLIGIEIKKIPDLLQCIVDKRFVGHQLPGLLESFEHAFLLIEGIIAPAPSRELQILHWDKEKQRYEWVRPPGERVWIYEGVMSWCASVRRTGIRDVQTSNRAATAAWLAAMWGNWSKPWESHRTLLGRMLKPMEATADALQVLTATPPMQAASILARGIGWEKASAAAAHFKSIRALVNADEGAWTVVPGIGTKLAREAVKTACKEY